MDGSHSGRYAAIVSDSRLSAETLKKCLETRFDGVQMYIGSVSSDWVLGADHATILIASTEPSATLTELAEALKTDDLARFVVLLRAGQTTAELGCFASKVGAVIPESASDATILRATLALDPEVCVLPRAFVQQNLRHTDSIGTGPTRPSLTQQEQRVFALISEALSNKAIADRLNISDSTVRVHVRSIVKKLGVRNRTEAALEAARVARPNQFENGVGL